MALPTDLGIIAGSKSLPLIFAREARKTARRLVAVGFHSETEPQLESLVDTMVWLRVGQLSRMIQTFTGQGIRHCVMLGQIAPRNLFDLRPDWRALGLLLRLKEKNAHTIFGAIINELKAEGVEVMDPRPWLASITAGDSLHLGQKLTREQRLDLDYAQRVAAEIARLEIGQTVVVKDGVILAVEALEGTDACLQRGGALAGTGGGAVAVKVAKPTHDMRFDVPCVGSRTVATCIASGVAVLGVEAGRSFVLDRAEIEERLAGKPFSLVTLKPQGA